jgi:predicted PurR-regulated permease PerM
MNGRMQVVSPFLAPVPLDEPGPGQPALLAGLAAQKERINQRTRLICIGGRIVTSDQPALDKSYLNRAVEVFIHLGLIFLLAIACLRILIPFIAVVAWGVIIAIACYPGYRRMKSLLSGRGGVASVFFTILLLGILIVPIALLTQTLVDGFQALAFRLHNETLTIPPPPSNIATWPIVGKPLTELWSLASNNLSAALGRLAPQLKQAANGLLSAAAGVGLGVLQFFVSILIAGFLLANSSQGAKVSRKLATRIFGDKGAEFEALAGATVRSVTTGILGVALIQSLLAALGFLAVRLPGAGLWTVLFLIAAVLQVGTLVLIPAVIYVFVTASIGKAVVFLIWCLVVGLMDNVLKPLLLGRGVPVPIVVVFLGAIGGFLAMGIIGLFVGPIVLSVGYKLFLAWSDEGVEPSSQPALLSPEPPTPG